MVLAKVIKHVMASAAETEVVIVLFMNAQELVPGCGYVWMNWDIPNQLPQLRLTLPQPLGSSIKLSNRKEAKVLT